MSTKSWNSLLGLWLWMATCSVGAADAPVPATEVQGKGLHREICPYLPDRIEVEAECGQLAITCAGTAGPDLIIGTTGDDVIAAGDGNDVILGNGGNDLICGGAGNDALMGSRGKDILLGGDGSDWLFGARGDDLLDGGAGDFDVLWGGPGIDALDGGAGGHDVCLLQKDMGDANLAGCDTLYPPVGYEHGQEHKPGVFDPGDGPDVVHRPAALIISCPWLPAGLAEVPTCGGKQATCMGTDGNDLIYAT
jgi:Ca2+-binding RTX toxin-like protein